MSSQTPPRHHHRLQVLLAASLRSARGDVGPLTIGTLTAAYAMLWLLFRPAAEPFSSHLGQLFGAESILLMSVAVVLISTLPWVEIWFNGIDRAATWRRRAAIARLLLLALHILLAKSRHGTALGVPLAAVGTIGLAAGLAGWSVLLRWRDKAAIGQNASSRARGHRNQRTIWVWPPGFCHELARSRCDASYADAAKSTSRRNA